MCLFVFAASTKRSHEWASSCGVGGGGEQIHRQASTSPVRSSGPAMLASASASPAPVSPPSSCNASVKKKMVSQSIKSPDFDFDGVVLIGFDQVFFYVVVEA